MYTACSGNCLRMDIIKFTSFVCVSIQGRDVVNTFSDLHIIWLCECPRIDFVSTCNNLHTTWHCSHKAAAGDQRLFWASDRYWLRIFYQLRALHSQITSFQAFSEIIQPTKQWNLLTFSTHRAMTLRLLPEGEPDHDTEWHFVMGWIYW